MVVLKLRRMQARFETDALLADFLMQILSWLKRDKDRRLHHRFVNQFAADADR